MTEEEEAVAILKISDGDLGRAMHILQEQLNVLHGRAQVIMSLAGIVMTVTGFSGRLIASTHVVSQVFVILGLGVVLLSAFWVFQKVMYIRWTTRDLGPDAEASVTAVLRRRNSKGRNLRIGGKILFAGLLLYFVAISIMLLNPEPLSVPVR